MKIGNNGGGLDGVDARGGRVFLIGEGVADWRERSGYFIGVVVACCLRGVC